jgi:hypothetical protein
MNRISVDPVILHSLYLLSDYPILAKFARHHTHAIKLDGRACQFIYAQSLPHFDLRLLSQHELAFIISLGFQPGKLKHS